MRLTAVAALSHLLLVGASGCGPTELPLRIDKNTLIPGKRGMLEAGFVTSRPVFRGPFAEGSEAAQELGLGLWVEGSSSEKANLGWTAASTGSSPEFVSVEVVGENTFAFVIDLPSEFSRTPWVLEAAVRPGEGGTEEWPFFLGRTVIDQAGSTK